MTFNKVRSSTSCLKSITKTHDPTMLRRLIQHAVALRPSSNAKTSSSLKSQSAKVAFTPDGPDRLSSLPGELLERIFSFLDLSALSQLRFTCQRIHDIATPTMLDGEITLIPYKSQINEVLQLLQNPVIARSIQTLNYVLLDLPSVLQQVEYFSSSHACHHFRGPFADRAECRINKERRRRQLRREELGDSLCRKEDPDEKNEIELLRKVFTHLAHLKSLRISFPEFLTSPYYEHGRKQRASPEMAATSYYQRVFRSRSTEWRYPPEIVKFGHFAMYTLGGIAAADVPNDINNVRRVIERSFRVFEALKSSSLHLEKLEFCKVPPIDSHGLAIYPVLPTGCLEFCSSLEKLVVSIAKSGKAGEDVTIIPALWESILSTAHDLRVLSISGDGPIHGMPRADLCFPMTTHVRALRNLTFSSVSLLDSALMQCLRIHAENLILVEFSDIELVWNGSNQPNSPVGWITIINLLRNELTLNHVSFNGKLVAKARREMWTVCNCQDFYFLSEDESELYLPDGHLVIPSTTDGQDPPQPIAQVAASCYCGACGRVPSLDGELPISKDLVNLYKQIVRYITHETDIRPPDLQELEDVLELVLNTTQDLDGGFSGDHSWHLTTKTNEVGFNW